MHKLENVFPKDNLFIGYLYAVAMSMILFGVSWIDMIIVLAIDTLAFFPAHFIELKIFYRIFPQYKKLKDFNKTIKDCGDNLELQNNLFATLTSFPWTRCVYLMLTTWFKVLPAGLYISYASKANATFGENLLLFYIADFFILSYIYGLLFIELHISSSEMIGQLKDDEGWKGNYRNLKLSFAKDNISLVQNSLLVVMLANLVFASYYARYMVVNVNYIAILFFVAILCIGRVQIKFQNFFHNALKGMFDLFEQNLSTQQVQVVPLHTSPLLAGFEYSFNQLGKKLEEREQEISQWLKHESEKFHLRTLGEITALVAHDIKTPLHVMQMSLDMMNDPITSEEDRKKYSVILETNLSQTISFTGTLMAYLRNSKDEDGCSFFEVHNHLLNLFKIQMLSEKFEQIVFVLANELGPLKLKMNRLNAMHVFYNLYDNAIKAVMTTDRPFIKIWSGNCVDTSKCDIFIHNNGASLEVASFKKMTSFDRFDSNGQFYHGLGLRLTQTLLNHLNGSIEIVPVDDGTCFKVMVPAEWSGTVAMNHHQ